MTYCGDYFIMYVNIGSWWCITETKRILLDTFTSIKKKGELHSWLFNAKTSRKEKYGHIYFLKGEERKNI